MSSPAPTEVYPHPIPMLNYEIGYYMIHYPNQKTGFTTDSRIFNIAKCLAKTTVGKPDADKWRIEESNGVPYSQRKNNDGLPEVTDDGVSWVTQGLHSALDEVWESYMPSQEPESGEGKAGEE